MDALYGEGANHVGRRRGQEREGRRNSPEEGGSKGLVDRILFS